MYTIEIADKLFWVGAVDWSIRDFHGYSTEKGTTYNSYLLRDEKNVLFDTVKKPFTQDLLHNIRRVMDPEQIDYIVVNHVEMDHSGALPDIIHTCKPEKIFCSLNGKKAMIAHFHNEDWPFEVVKTGDSLSVGKRTIQFLETRMLHWPDSMFSYIPEDKILISSDAFGQHWATSERFADEVDEPELFRHAAKYYANILLLFSTHVQKLLATVGEMGLEFDMICPDHGLIWRGDSQKIIAAYDSWSRQEPKQKALIIYESMWESTEKMAKAVAFGLLKQDVKVKMLDLKLNHRSDIMTEVLDARALLFGSATLNNGMLPNVADFMMYLRGLAPANKIGAAFGSYGWSGEAVKLMNERMQEMKIDVVDEGLRVRYVPTHEDLGKCVELGAKMGKAMKQK
jgi:flavorubredoxin